MLHLGAGVKPCPFFTPRKPRDDTMTQRLDYKSNIPLAREILEALDKDLYAKGDFHSVWRVRQALSLMHRASPVRRTRARQPSNVTPAVKRALIAKARTTDWSQQQLADYFGINPGRVSEILHGLR